MCLSQAAEISRIESLVQKQLASAPRGLRSSEEWEEGLVGVTLRWCDPIAWPSSARWNQPQLLQQPLCQAILAPPATYMIRRRAFLTDWFWDPPSCGQATCQWTGQVELITSLSNTEKELFWIFHSHCQNRNGTSASHFSFSLTSHPERNQDLALSNAVESSRGS